MYIKYKLQKKQVSHDGGVTWVDVVPLEQRVGESAGTYNTLEECEEIDYSTQYLTIESLEDNNEIYIIAKPFTSINPKTISASTDNGDTWAEYTSTSGGTMLATLNAGDKLLLKGENASYNAGGGVYNYFNAAKQYNVYGNIMSLVSGDSFANADELTESKTFADIFYGNTKLVSAENLILPATTLTTHCYYEMFSHCTSLTTAPSILPATTLPMWCYGYMFAVCPNLTTAPVLPATTLAQYCYEGMFNGSINLSSITCLATDISATGCTNGWVYNVASTGTFIKAASMTGWSTGTSGIPTNWTVQNA